MKATWGRPDGNRFLKLVKALQDALDQSAKQRLESMNRLVEMRVKSRSGRIQKWKQLDKENK